jgi:hypothetical protein
MILAASPSGLSLRPIERAPIPKPTPCPTDQLFWVMEGVAILGEGKHCKLFLILVEFQYLYGVLPAAILDKMVPMSLVTSPVGPLY